MSGQADVDGLLVTVSEDTVTSSRRPPEVNQHRQRDSNEGSSCVVCPLLSPMPSASRDHLRPHPAEQGLQVVHVGRPHQGNDDRTWPNGRRLPAGCGQVTTCQPQDPSTEQPPRREIPRIRATTPQNPLCTRIHEGRRLTGQVSRRQVHGLAVDGPRGGQARDTQVNEETSKK